MPKTPQLILTLSPFGSIQAELPGPNGSRRVVTLEGSPAQIIESLHRLLAHQALGQTQIGQLGAPTASQTRDLPGFIEASSQGECPFCKLGIKHSPYYCNTNRKPKKTHKVSPTTKSIVAAFAPAVSPEDLGL